MIAILILAILVVLCFLFYGFYTKGYKDGVKSTGALTGKDAQRFIKENKL